MTAWLKILVVLLCMASILMYPSIDSKGQNIVDLDAANGFKEFKFGMPKSNWAGELGDANANLYNTYAYTGFCCSSAFGSAIGSIDLSFDNSDKLNQVIITLRDKKMGEELMKPYNTVRAAFGEITSGSTDKATYDIIYQWVGKKVGLTLYNEYKGAVQGGWEITLWFSDAKKLSNPARDY